MQRVSKFKKHFLYAMIASLVLSALVGITAIIFNNWTDTTARIIGSLGLVLVHSFLSVAAVRDEKSSANQLKYFSEILFWLIVSSLLTSLLATWQLLEAGLTSQLYLFYFVVGSSVLQGNLLYLLTNKGKVLSRLVWASLYSIAAVVAMLFPVIFFSTQDTVSDFYYRILGSLAIIDFTLTVIAVILYKLHLQKHPKESNVLAMTGGFGGIIRVIIGVFLLYFLFQLVIWLLFMSFSAID
jgi:hypothetical protein